MIKQAHEVCDVFMALKGTAFSGGNGGLFRDGVHGLRKDVDDCSALTGARLLTSGIVGYA